MERDSRQEEGEESVCRQDERDEREEREERDERERGREERERERERRRGRDLGSISAERKACAGFETAETILAVVPKLGLDLPT